MRSLGDRMKAYETAEKVVQRMPLVLRVDGRSFRTFCRGLERPYSRFLLHAMQEVGLKLMNEVQGSFLAYGQSDEVSLVAVDYKNHGSTHWFGGKTQKIASVSASAATLAFDDCIRRIVPEKGGRAMFDARVFSIPEADLGNYLLWRGQDAYKNFILSLARSEFGHARIQDKNIDKLSTMLLESGIDVSHYHPSFRYGWICRQNHSPNSGSRFWIDSACRGITDSQTCREIIQEELEFYLEHE